MYGETFRLIHKDAPSSSSSSKKGKTKNSDCVILAPFQWGWIGGEGEFDKIRNILSFKGLENNIRYGGRTVLKTVSRFNTVYTACTLIILLKLPTMLTMLSLLSLPSLLTLFTLLKQWHVPLYIS